MVRAGRRSVGSSCCHTDMELARALVMGRELLDAHGLTQWKVAPDRARRRAGSCQYTRQTITISGALTVLHSQAEVRETLLHEIAHALAGHAAGHGPVWRSIALSIGSTGERCLSQDAPTLPGNWVGTCANGHTVQRHRRPARVGSCTQCGSGFDLSRILTWTYRGQPAAMTPGYDAELRAIREHRPHVRVNVGDQVRVVVGGRWKGTVGRVVKRGRTKYHVLTPAGVLAVPFVGVEPMRTAD